MKTKTKKKKKNEEAEAEEEKKRTRRRKRKRGRRVYALINKRQKAMCAGHYIRQAALLFPHMRSILVDIGEESGRGEKKDRRR